MGIGDEDLKLDLDELRQLHRLAKRPKNISIISSHISSLQQQLSSKAAASPDAASCGSTSSAPVPPKTTVHYVTLGSFSWDQDNDKIKIYVFLEGIDENKVDTVFKPTSVDIKFHEVQGKNYRCAIPKLNKEIDPEKCKVLVKPSKVIITLYKASKGNWLDLHFKDDKLKPNLDKEKDPMAGIMDLMKNMYEEGDDEMKRTIAKAWTDARSGKTTDSLKGIGP